MSIPPLKFARSFRDYQKAAIAMARGYVRAFAKRKTDGASLVCHPTGTGKTAVIAGLVHASPEIKSVLVLTTREAVRDQLTRELSGNLFIDPGKFDLGEKVKLPKVTYLIKHRSDLSASARQAHAQTLSVLNGSLVSFASRQFDRLAPDSTTSLWQAIAKGQAVLVMTVQMLAAIHRSGQRPTSLYAKLAKHLDLVIFDEGHYEPAVTWSQVVRGLNRPLTLLSATPFRNDLKPFLVHEKNIHIYKYHDASEAEYVRRVLVRPRDSIVTAEGFCADIINFCRKEFGQDQQEWPRIIIHCDEKSRITQLGEEFLARRFRVVGIHDRYPDAKSPQHWQVKHVPPPAECDAQVWIHQYKLMEGIDDHRFQVLAFFDLLSNVRQVVQQIGRIIRMPRGGPNVPAFVLDHYNGRIWQYWEQYKKYDRSLDAKYLTLTLSRFYLDKFAANLPLIDYIDGKFRPLLKINEVQDAADEVLFERRVTFRRVDARVDINVFTQHIENDFELRDYQFAKGVSTSDVALYLYASVESPPFLHSRFFAEVRHGARLVLILRKQRLMAIADTSGTHHGFAETEAIDTKSLESLISGGRISSVSSKNTNLGNRVIRRRSISAVSISDVPPILDEHGHIIATVTGYNGDRPRIEDALDYVAPAVDLAWQDRNAAPPTARGRNTAASDPPTMIRRYIGIANGRVSEVGPPLRLTAFREWVQSLAEQMLSSEPIEGVFDRYAGAADRMVQDAMPQNLLLDLYDLHDQWIHRTSRQPIYGDELCVDRLEVVSDTAAESKARFRLTLNDEAHLVDATFYKKSQHYRLDSATLDDTFVPRNDAHGLNFTRTLNERQAFNVIPDDRTVIYVHGRFYAPALKFGAQFTRDSFYVGQCLYPCEILKGLDSEKGRHVLRANGSQSVANGQKFDPKSTFGLIDAWRDGFDTKHLQLSREWVKQYAPEAFSFTPTLLICDDMQDETADFILADETQRRVVLIHAKAALQQRPYSASAVQEVCAQAQKNAALLSLFTLREPGNLPIWNDAHQFKGTEGVTLRMAARIRKPLALDAAAAWRRLEPLLRNPLTMREVWLVLGNMVSAGALAASLANNDPPSEALQLNHLLQTTIAAMGSAGAKTRIFCMP